MFSRLELITSVFISNRRDCMFSFKALILKLKDPDPNPGVVISVLATIGELAQVRLEFSV